MSLEENVDKCATMRTEIAVQNLRRQLGFRTDTTSILGQFSNPYLAGVEDCVLWRNRNMLEVSMHVDNWLTICGGKQMGYMAMNNSNMKLGEVSLKLEGGDIWEKCIRLEDLRFMFQISVLDPEHSYLDQSLTFLGVSMENLRSMLAQWVEMNLETQQDSWSPRMRLETSSDGGLDERTIEFTASAEFECLLNSITSEKLLPMRFLQMRLL